MASTTEELTGQADQLMSALGFFRTGDNGRAPAARPASVKPASPAKVVLANPPKGNGHAIVPPELLAATNSGVAIKLNPNRDGLDEEFERY